MRPFLPIALLLILSTSAVAGGRRRTAAASPAPDALAIVFVGMNGSASDAFFDAGAATSGTTLKTFGIRLDATAGRTGTAVLRAWLESNDGRTAIRIDGKPLGPLPQVIDAHASLGRVTTHRIEIVVPADVNEGAFGSAIRWDVTTNSENP